MRVWPYLSRNVLVTHVPAQRTQRVSVRLLDLRLEMPFRIAYDTMTHARNVVVQAGGGWGEAAPVPTINGETQAQVMADVQGRGGTVSGRCALDTARWDQRARDEDVPLCTALTGALPRPVQTSITIPLVEDHEIDALVQRRLSQGYTIFKVKAGLDVDRDLARLARIRQAIGERELRVDANQGWSPTAAARALAPLRDLQVAVLEQPLAKHDLAGHAELRRLSARIEGPPIMLDESVFDAVDAQRAIAAGAADWINIKLQKSGGLTEALRIADFAQDNGVPCMVGCMLESRIGILHGAHLVAAHANILKADLDGAALLADDPVQGGPGCRSATIHLDDAPGIGVTGVAA